MNMTCGIMNEVEVTSRFVLPEYNSPRERLVSSTNTMANSWAIMFGDNIMETKRCRKCDEVKPTSEFYKVRASKDGLHSWCSTCNREYAKSRPKINHPAKMTGYKICTKCYMLKSIHKFSRNIRSSDGRMGICKQCDSNIKLLRPIRTSVMSGNKVCVRCNKSKSVLLFYKDNRASDGRQSTCKECSAKSQRKSKYMRRFGLSLEEYEDMANRQNDSCSICGIHRSFLNKDLVVDHNHITGKIRGLLCDTCNRAIGLLKDNIDVLLNAITYLREEDEE